MKNTLPVPSIPSLPPTFDSSDPQHHNPIARSSSNKMSESSTPRGAVDEAMRPSTLHNHGTSLLSLPAEIRNMIWRYTLLQEDELVVTATTDIMPPLTRVCQQIIREAAPIYFSEQKFHCLCPDYDATAFHHFVRVIGRFWHGHVRCVLLIMASPIFGSWLSRSLFHLPSLTLSYDLCSVIS